MGHSVYSDYVQHSSVVERRKQDQDAQKRSRSYPYGMFHARDMTDADRAVSILIDEWDEYEGSPSMAAAKQGVARSASAAALSFAYNSRVNSQQSFAIPCYADEDCTKKVKKIEISLTEEEWKNYGYRNHHLVFKKLINLFGKDAAHIAGWQLLNPKNDELNRGWEVKGKISAGATEGKAKTVYYLQANQGRVNVPGENRFETMAAARAAGIKFMKENLIVTDVAVKARVERDGENEELVSISREVSQVTGTFEITLLIPKANAEIKQWLAGFDYHN